MAQPSFAGGLTCNDIGNTGITIAAPGSTGIYNYYLSSTTTTTDANAAAAFNFSAGDTLSFSSTALTASDTYHQIILQGSATEHSDTNANEATYQIPAGTLANADVSLGVKITSSMTGDLKITCSPGAAMPSNTAPSFIGSTTTLSLTSNAAATDITNLLHVSDTDSGQTLTWSQSSAPSHGTLIISGATAFSGTTDITPGGTITYQPAANYIGNDSFTVQVSDGTDTATFTISVTVSAPAATTYTVTYSGNTNGGGTAPTDATAYSSGATVTVASNSGNLTKTNFTFAGWNTAADGSGTTYAAGSGTFTITGNTTLYAKWTAAVTYNGNSNTGGAVPTDATAYSSGASVTSASNSGNLTKTNFTFAGWNTAADGSGTTYAAGSGTFTITGNTTLYAKWNASGTTSQTITFPQPSTQTVGTPLTLSATASSGLTVTYTVSGGCATGYTLSGSTITFSATGNCVITASQDGNSTYSAASNVIRYFNVVRRQQTLTLNWPGTQNAGTLLTLSATASSGLTVTYSSFPTSVCTISGSTVTFVGQGLCRITASQAGNDSYDSASATISVEVGPAPPTSTTVTISSITLTTTTTTTGSTGTNTGGGTTGTATGNGYTASATIPATDIAAGAGLHGNLKVSLSSSDTGTSNLVDVADPVPVVAKGNSPICGCDYTATYDTSKNAFTVSVPEFGKDGARVSQSRTSADSILHAATNAPAVPVYKVAAPRVLVVDTVLTIKLTDSTGKSVNIDIPIKFYEPGEVADLVAISVDKYSKFGATSSSAPVLSRDGQVISFSSNAANFGNFANVTSPQIFRYASALATVDMISQATMTGDLGGIAAAGASMNPALSADGSVLAFASDAANIYPFSVFTQATTRQIYTMPGNGAIGVATPSPNPAVLVNGAPAAYAFDHPALSADGTKLAFDTTAPLAGTAGGVSQVYLKNMTTGLVSLVSATAAGIPGDRASLNPSISDDGRFVLFESDATNLTAGSSNRQVYLKDMTSGALTLISGTQAGPGNGASLNAKLSGQVTAAGAPGYAVFESDASNLVSASNNAIRQVYRANLSTGAVNLVSANSAGLAVGGSNGAISGDGRFVVFKSTGAVTGTSAPLNAQIYVSDIFAGTSALVSADVNGLPANGASDTPAISADGRVIGFASLATNLDGTDTKGVNQIYAAANKLVPPLVTGFWVNPNAPGQYWGIEQSGNNVWLAGFGFNNDNTPGWAFAFESPVTKNSFQGNLTATANGPALAGTGGPAVIAANLGTTGLTLGSQTSGALSWLSSSTPIQRQDIVTGGSSAGPVAGYPETGWWYAPSTNQSLFLEVQGTTLLANIASYTQAGKATWYQTTGAMTSAQAYSGQLNACTGGAAPNCSTNAGPVSMTFSSTLAGTITLPGGKALAIQRWRF